MLQPPLSFSPSLFHIFTFLLTPTFALPSTTYFLPFFGDHNAVQQPSARHRRMQPCLCPSCVIPTEIGPLLCSAPPMATYFSSRWVVCLSFLWFCEDFRCFEEWLFDFVRMYFYCDIATWLPLPTMWWRTTPVFPTTTTKPDCRSVLFLLIYSIYSFFIHGQWKFIFLFLIFCIYLFSEDGFLIHVHFDFM